MLYSIQETAEHVGISAMPTFNFYKNSEKVGRYMCTCNCML